MLVTLEEMKDFLSVDFDYKDKEITSRIKSSEGYLVNATGVNFAEVDDRSAAKAVAREWLMLKVYLDYYLAHTDIDDARLTALMKQLQYTPTDLLLDADIEGDSEEEEGETEDNTDDLSDIY